MTKAFPFKLISLAFAIHRIGNLSVCYMEKLTPHCLSPLYSVCEIDHLTQSKVYIEKCVGPWVNFEGGREVVDTRFWS